MRFLFYALIDRPTRAACSRSSDAARSVIEVCLMLVRSSCGSNLDNT